MKTLLFLLCAARCLATSVSLEWDKNPDAEIAYTLEAKPGAELDPGEWKPVASTPALTITVTTLKPGLWSFRLRAVTLDGTLQSDPSNIVTTVILPDKPKGLRIVLESSRDMEAWEPVATYEVHEADRAFYRIAFTQ
ncbi:MAG: hypothetical protein IPO08_21160 [Xanthomonadales bacterium]|nr:hypothetical protein [Xanthomonadales bacterium]